MVLAGLTEGSQVEANASVYFISARVLATNESDTDNENETSSLTSLSSDNFTTPLTSSSSDSSSSSGIIVGIVFAVIAVVAVIVAGVCLRRKKLAKQKKGDAQGERRSSGVPRVVERPRKASERRSIPFVSDFLAPDAPRVVERPRFATTTRTHSVPPAGDLPPPPERPGVPSGGGRYDIAKAVLEIAHKLARESRCPGVSEAAALVSTLVNLISDGRNTSAEVDARLKKCRLLVTMLERAVMVLGKVRVLLLYISLPDVFRPSYRTWLQRREIYDKLKL